MPWDDHRSSYRPGSFYRMCQRSGLVAPAEDTVKEWTGLWVRRDMADERNPQDFVRGRPDKQAVPNPVPEPADVFLEANEVTADDL